MTYDGREEGQLMKQTLLWITIFSILAGWAFYAEKSSYTAPTINSSPESILTQVKALESWVDRLGELEGCSPTGTMDNNGQLSYGHWCFQNNEDNSTWNWMFGEYNDAMREYPFIEPEEYHNLIGDRELQRRVVLWNIEHYPERDWHWGPVKTHLIERAPRS